MRVSPIPLVAFATLVSCAPVLAAPCHDVRGDWTFTLQCAALGPAPIFGTRTLYASISAQEGCTFTGTLSPVATGGGEPWVGALHGEQNRQVASDYAGAKATGELAERHRGLFREMSMTYTYSGGPNPTACTGVGVRAD